mgnify:FL=1
MHASADAGPVDVVVDGETVVSGVEFSELSNGIAAPSVSSDYYEVPVSVGTTIEVQDSGGNAVISTTASQAGLQEDAQYTVVVAGAIAAQEQGADTPQPIVLRDRFQRELGDNEVGIRLVHGSGFAGAVDIYLNAPGTELQQEELLAQDFQFTSDFPGGFPGQFASQAVSEQGSVLVVTPHESTLRVLELPVGGDQEGGLSVSGGQYITGVAIDDPSSEPRVGALVQVDQPQEQ